MTDPHTPRMLPLAARSRRLVATTAAVTLLLALPLAACGDDSDDGEDGDEATAATTTEASTSTSATTPAPAPEASCEPGTMADRSYILCTTDPRSGGEEADGQGGQDDVQGLVVALHGRGSSAEEMQAVTELHRYAAAKGWAVVYPDGLDAGWGDDTFTTPTRPTGREDLDFLDDLIAELRSNPRIDDEPVGVVGFSNGASMALRYAAQRPDEVRAVASVAGQLPLDPAVHPSTRMPLLQIYGRDDPVRSHTTGIPASADREPDDPTPTLSTPDTVAAFVDAAGDDLQHEGSTETDPDPTDETTLRTETWTEAGATVVVLRTILGGGHTWPSPKVPMETPIDFGTVSHDVDASAEAIWFVTDPDDFDPDAIDADDFDPGT